MMKKTLVLIMFLALMPFCYAIKTGVIIDVQGDVYSGCVYVNKDKSAYDVLSAFDKNNQDIKISFDGLITGTPFLKSINDIEGKSAGDNAFSGWNFWISDDDNGFTEPPELAPGWGMGLGDYKIIKENDVIGINFGVTEYNADWTVKTKPDSPQFIEYSALCEKLGIKDINVKVDGKTENGADENGGKIDVSPGSKIEIEINLENLYSSDTKKTLKDVYVKATADDIDVEKESDEKDILAGKDKTFKLEFVVPLDVDYDSFDMDINAYSEEEYGLEHNKEINYEIEIDREKHSIAVTESKAIPENVYCKNNFALELSLLNTGKEDETVKVAITDESGILLKEDSFDIKDTEKITKTYNIDLGERDSGEYPIDIIISYYGQSLKEKVVIKKSCDENTQAIEDVILKELSEQKKEEPKIEIDLKTTDSQKVVTAKIKKKEDFMPYLLLAGFGIGIIISITLIIILKKP